jgi:anti-sigma regulatory factor (Ser/Thr protein kinase)
MDIQRFNITARLDYTPESIDRFVDLCEEVILSITDNRRARFLLKTAVDELTLNAIEHGYGKNPGLVTIFMEHCGDAIRFEISDFGCGIDPARVHLDRVALTEDDLQARGWAFSILDKLSDGVEITDNEPRGARITLMVPLKERITNAS